MDNHCMGSLFIVAAPSGGGKTSLVKKLINDLNNIDVAISHTTRDKRANEASGVDYFFVDESTFNTMIQQNAFVEYAQVFNHFYGTSIAQIQQRLQAGTDVVLDIDWQGARQIKRLFPDSVSIFVIPPSLEVLQQRLTDRQRDNAQVILDRMQRAHDEMSHYEEFDYLIVNDIFDVAASELKSIVVAQRLRISHQAIRQQKLLSFLLSST